MQALRYFPNGDDKLALVNLDDANTDPEFIIKNPDEVVIQVYNAGLCGTDIHIVQVKLLIKIFYMRIFYELNTFVKYDTKPMTYYY